MMKSPATVNIEPSAPLSTGTPINIFPTPTLPSAYPSYPTAAPPPYSLAPTPIPDMQVHHPVGKETIIIQHPITVLPTQPLV